jgi:DNA repair exonuclease SbcCD nuclease subunit
MTTALTRPNPFSTEFVNLDLAQMPSTQDHASPEPDQPPIGVVATGDNHLSAYLPRLSPQRRAERRARLRAGFAAAVDTAIERRARLFLQLGDLFDTPTPSNEDRAFVAGALARMSAAGIVCAGIGGNHDTPRMTTEQGGASPQRVFEALRGMRYFSRHDALIPALYTFGRLRIAVAGLSNNPVAAPGSDPLRDVAIDDPDNTLGQARIALLMLHAGVEGLCRPSAGERIVTRASLEALPPVFSAIVAGHIHHFARERVGHRTVVVTGATERMEFGAPRDSSGFVWMELDTRGVRRVEHIHVREQPRADLLIPTARLWPVSLGHREQLAADEGINGPQGSGEASASLSVDLDTEGRSERNGYASAVDALGRHWQSHVLRADTETPLDVIKETLAEVCSPETMVRLRLAGPLTRDQYHELALRDILLYGQQHAFSFDLDTSELTLLQIRPARGDETGDDTPDGGRVVTLDAEIERMLMERLAQPDQTGPAWEREQRAAADLLRERLLAARDREAGE